LSVADVAVLGTVGVIIYANIQSKRSQEGTALTSVTVALNVPNRFSRRNILYQLESLSNTADTTRRTGVANLISDVALELLRQDANIVSAAATFQHFANDVDGQREFNRVSTMERAKLDKEAINKFGTTNIRAAAETSPDADMAATMAIVTLHLSLDAAAAGDLRKRAKRISTREDLKDTLATIAAQAQVPDALLGGEVLWAPTRGSERLTEPQVFANYPNLVPL
jgi:uncharacterized membrane protein